jgi:hypothetical protein
MSPEKPCGLRTTVNPAVVLIAVIGVVLVARWLWHQPPAVRKQILTSVLLVGGVLALLFALVSGRLHPLIAAGGGALLLLRRLFAAKQIFDRFNTGKSAGSGARSSIATRFLDMSLDHDSGDMDGTVREGRFTGRSLSQMSIDELLELLAQCRAGDAQSAGVLEAYLDRAHGHTWRERADAGPGAQHAAAGSTSMSAAEARDILGIAEAASREEIVSAHRKLMLKLHPDRGGSNYLATKVNLAKEVLLKTR